MCLTLESLNQNGPGILNRVIEFATQIGEGMVDFFNKNPLQEPLPQVAQKAVEVLSNSPEGLLITGIVAMLLGIGIGKLLGEYIKTK